MLSRSFARLLLVFALCTPVLMKADSSVSVPGFLSFLADTSSQHLRIVSKSQIPILKQEMTPNPRISRRAYLEAYRAGAYSQLQKVSEQMYRDLMKDIRLFSPTYEGPSPALTKAEKAMVGDRQFGEIVLAWPYIDQNVQKQAQKMYPA